MEYLVAKTYDEIFSAFIKLKDAFFHFDGDLSLFAEKIYKNGICVLTKADSVAGLIAFYANDTLSGTAYITSLLVDAKARGQGIATTLVKKAETISAEKGFTQMKLEVRKDNLPAISLYKKLGYVVDSENTHSIYMCKCIEV